VILTDALPTPAQTLIVEASAGTGKTWTMSTLAARFIAETGVEIPHIAIVTFSSAAAAEVRSRTHARLRQCAEALAQSSAPDNSDDPGLAQIWSPDAETRSLRRHRLAKALDDFDLAPIMTTHGFCDRLLTWLGILADHDPTDQLALSLTELIDRTTSDQYLTLRATTRPAFSYDQALAWVHKALFAPSALIVPAGTDEARFTESVRRAVETSKRRAGLYTFDDMLLRCRAALTDPATGGQARARVAQMYPVVLVDEFQDTDPVQWDVIRLGFVGTSAVVLIGDPKQSIYGFRGADVDAYLAATDIADVKNLAINYRSAPELVETVGKLLQGAELGDPRISVKPVQASPGNPRLIAPAPTPWHHPLRIRIPADTDPRPVDQARDLIDADLVADLLRLIDRGPAYQPDPHGQARPLRLDDIAILVSTNRRGADLVERLRVAGLPAVFTGTGSVFATPAARDWLTLLQALQSGTAPRIRAASLTSLIGWDLRHLVHAGADDFAGLAALMRQLAAILDAHTPIAVLEWLMDQTDLVARLTGEPGGERTLADLRHIGDRLSGPRPLGVSPADWLQALRLAGDARDDDARQLPIPSGAVRILTVHQAKGSQFPIVYLPQLADRYVAGLKLGESAVSHDAAGHRIVDLGLPGQDGEARAQAVADDAGESLRSCYVALTRATAHITTWWVPSSQNIQSSALHRLLFRTSPNPPARIELEGCDPRRIAIPGVSVETMPDVPAPRYPAAGIGPATANDHPVPDRPATDPWLRQIDTTWRRTSFSALTAGAHQVAPDTDESAQPYDASSPLDADPALDQASPMADLPGGTAFGSLVHSVFEYADPAADLTPLVSQAMRTSGFDSFAPERLAAALAPGLTTPLGLAGGVCLADIPLTDRLAELNFELPLAQNDQAATLTAVAGLLGRHLGADDPLRDYPERLVSPELDQRALRGYLSGSIDAVLKVSGRYIIVDYKTNRLGPPDEPLTLRHYTQPAMAAAMMSSHYPLQALLYAVALHRFLRWRLPGYEPGRHLGGIRYLFVRGMAGPDTPVRYGTPCGVFPWQPPPRLIEELSDLLSGVSS